MRSADSVLEIEVHAVTEISFMDVNAETELETTVHFLFFIFIDGFGSGGKKLGGGGGGWGGGGELSSDISARKRKIMLYEEMEPGPPQEWNRNMDN